MVKAIRILDDVYWVGAIDWNLRDFHGYPTSRGSTYNAFLIVDEKVTLIDTVKASFAHEMFSRIESVVDPSEIDVVVSNHTEMDHSGCLPLIMERAKGATLVTSKRAGEMAIARHFHAGWPLMPVADGDEISLGKRALRFYSLSMLHWPDSMATYLVDDQVLFSNDAFGQHLATAQLFDDGEDLAVVMDEARKYYASIVMPLGTIVQRALEKLKGLPLKMIAPCHGVLWRSQMERIVEAYAAWSSGAVKPKAVVVYDSMWGSTAGMAVAIADGIASSGLEVKVYNLSCSPVTDVLADLLESKALALGSATVNNGMISTVAGFLNTLKGLRPKNKKGVAFGSYGWGGGAVKGIEQQMQDIGIELAQPGLGVMFVPDEKDLATCFALGQTIAASIR